MNLAEYSIKNKLITALASILIIFGGWSAYKGMARFEDPEFTIRTAVVFTQYPGASPEEVAKELTEPLETAIQQLQEVELISSKSSAGLSEINVDIKYNFSKTKDELQLIWTKLRNKVKDAERSLPPGVGTPIVNDDFGDVYGFYYLVTGEGFTPNELKAYTKSLKKELLSAEGVGKVSIAGQSNEAIFVEVSKETLKKFGLSFSSVFDILGQQNAVVSAGDVKIGEKRIMIDPSGAIDSVSSIRNLLVTTSADGRVIYLKDIARVWRGYRTPPSKVFRYNGEAALAMGISAVQGSNVVEVGKAVDKKLEETTSRRPYGIEIHEFYNQGKVVELSVSDFVVNVIAALVIVIVILFIFMGFKSAIIIGIVLLMTIFATLATMNYVSIPMHRISLGALIIALGMMVDNAIVVTEGILVGVQSGKKKLDIAKEIVTQTQWPLLGGTLVGIVAFAPIGLAPGSTAEYTGHLFWVILISLMFSWVFAITLTPLLCYLFFSEGMKREEGEESGFYKKYKSFMGWTLRLRWALVTTVVLIFALSLWGFGYVKSGFFPASTTPQFVIDYWLPEGTDINRTWDDVKKIEEFMAGQKEVNGIQTIVGGGGLRYMLIYGPEPQNSSYAQLLVRVDDYKEIGKLLPLAQNFIQQNFPNAQAKVWRFMLGPGGGSKIEATFRGPDPVVLRDLVAKTKGIMVEEGRALSIKDSWRQPVSVIEPVFSEIKGRRAGISREDLAYSLEMNFSGKNVGVFRENDELIPIVARAPMNERANIDEVNNVLVMSSVTGKAVPIGQVVEGFKTTWRNGLLKREDRIWTIKAQCDPYPDELASDLLSRLMPKIEAIPLPDGYELEWEGEYGNSKESNENLASAIPFGFLTMALIVIVLFNALRQPLIIWLAVPLSIIGVVVGLLVTGTPMEFMGILGVLSLSGLLIKNAIVLVDQIDFEIGEGKEPYQAVVDSATSRMRPVMMGALTTVLGVIPLFFDAFFKSMAVVLVFGLTFATLLTLVVIPAFYAIFFRIRPKAVT